MKSLDLFATVPENGRPVPETKNAAELEAAIDIAFSRVIGAPDFASAMAPSKEMAALIAQRTAARVKTMEKARGLAR